MCGFHSQSERSFLPPPPPLSHRWAARGTAEGPRTKCFICCSQTASPLLSWWFKEKRIRKKLQITAPSYHKISVLCGITSGDGSLRLALSLPCYTVVKSGVVRTEWSQETTIQFIDEYKKRPLIWDPKHPSIKFITNSNSVRDILVKFLYRPLAG